MLVHAVVVHDRDVPGLPIVAEIVMNLVTGAVEDVEGGLVDMAMLLAPATRTVFLDMQMKVLGNAVLRLDIMSGIGLRPVDEADFARLAHPRHGAQPFELFAKVISALNRADEYPVLFRMIITGGLFGLRCRRCLFSIVHAASPRRRAIFVR